MNNVLRKIRAFILRELPDLFTIGETNMKDFRPQWKAISIRKDASAKHHLQQLILQAMWEEQKGRRKADSLLRESILRTFTPIKNPKKLANGLKPWGAVQQAVIDSYEDIAMGHILGVPTTDLLTFEESQRVLGLLKGIDTNEYARQYVYVFVRQDIFPEYQLVQAAHATMELGNRLKTVKDLYFTVVGVPDIAGLAQAIKLLQKKGVEYTSFIEPDIGHQMTAIAAGPIPMRERGELLNYKLLRFNRS